MTDLLGGAGQAELLIEPDDSRARANYFSQYPGEFRHQGEVGDQRNPWWPGGAAMLGDAGDVGLLIDWQGYNLFDLSRGCNSTYGFTGVTRDVYGSPLGGVTVKCYHAADDIMVATVVSDPQGNYLVTTPYGLDSHYLVFYKTGAPDVFGTTQNTLVGS
jgi:hypothetical protein